MNVAQFERDGIVFPAGQIEVAGFEARYRAFQEASRRLRGKETYLKPHLVSAWLDGVVRHPEILERVEQLLGPNIILWVSDWSVKRAGTGDYVPWHQDAPYWNLSTDEVVSVWLAIGDATEENGAMQVVLGSHKDGAIGPIDAPGNIHEAYDQGRRTTDPDCMFPFAHLREDQSNRAVPVVLRSGEYSIHSVNLVHGGGPNPSGRDRIGLAMRFISAGTRNIGVLDSVTAIRGDCVRDCFVYEPRPDGEFTPSGLAALEEALAYPSGFGEAKRIR